MAERRFGARMLASMGWEEGTGLGKRGNGILEPVIAKRRKDNSGLGVTAARPYAGEQWYEKMMREAYGDTEKKSDVELFKACDGRRCRPHGTGKLARLERSEAVDDEPVSSAPESDEDEGEDEAQGAAMRDILGTKHFVRRAKKAGVELTAKDRKRLRRLDRLATKLRSCDEETCGELLRRATLLESKVEGSIAGRRRDIS